MLIAKRFLITKQLTTQIAGSPEDKAARLCGSTWQSAIAPAFALGVTIIDKIIRK
ncbi:MAG: hypothetical protein Q4F84_01020 [Fibrobacter sp.]|nr:hypothetical protein [Fibrobacter sp.]